MPNSSSLAHCRILVTRPAHQAEGLCRRISEHGGEPIRLPTLAIGDLSTSDEAQALLSRLADYHILVFVSPNAVRLGLAAIQRHGGLPAGTTLATVGEGSARALREALGRGPDLVPGDTFDSEGLLALPALQAVAGRRILILRGEDGRTLLAETLRQRGAQVDYLAIYQRLLPSLPVRLEAWPQHTDIITVTSSEGLRNLCRLTPPAQQARLFALPLVVVSSRTAQLATELGFVQPARVARRASDEAIVESLLEWAATPRATP